MAGYNWGALGQVGGGLAGLFGGGKNPADVANGYINQIPGQTQSHYQPWEDAGRNQLGSLGEQYNQGMNDPGGKLNDIGSHFQQSPGFKFALEQALQGGNHAAAAGGMAGSPAHEQANMQMSTDMASQDYNNWLKQATGLYGNAMTGAQGMANQGQQAGQSQANTIAQTLAQQGQYGYEGQAGKNKQRNGAFSDILGGLGGMFF